ncbi:oxygenase MpaB family protein [Flavobacterium sp. SUN052]|uniref:oxygenase MpaB family protein n=1 Tax=Flavobacterium sp. SUN052 TaxID=3002441 RepID=UPI00237D7A0E|nr:oxygenase MpaB family protein [Flavobacterium sp. SUN052]MEC4004811.1 oxygenase MpaB family protein [Flavobacterium sp. SUN052]
MNYFVDEKSIVREIWKNTDVVLLIFAGSAAEFALNKAVDWLYFTGKIPTNPLERLFSTVEYAQKIVFAENKSALATIDKITQIHQGVEKSRGQTIPDWAYRDVLYMLIDYSIRSFELLERKLKPNEKEEIFNVFLRLGTRMGLKNLPTNFYDWEIDRNLHLENDLQKGKFTIHLFHQYKKHLGSFRYFILIQIQQILVPSIVHKQLFQFSNFPTITLLKLYKSGRKFKLDHLIKYIILPKKYKEELIRIGKFESL